MATTTATVRLLTVLTAAVAGMPTDLEMRQFVADMLRHDRAYAPVLAERVKVKNVPQSLKTVVKDQNDVDPLVMLHTLKKVVNGGGGGRPWSAAAAASLYSGNALETSMTVTGSAYRCRTLKRIALHVTLTARAADLEPGENGAGVRAALLLAYAVPYAMDMLLAFGQSTAELMAVNNAVGLQSEEPAAGQDPPADQDPPAVRYAVGDGYAHRLSEQLPALNAAIAETCVRSDEAHYYDDLKTDETAVAPVNAPAAVSADAAAPAANDLPTVVAMLEQNANAILDAYDDASRVRNAGAITWKRAFGTADLTLDSIGFRRTIRPTYFQRTTAFLEQYWSNTVVGGPPASQ